MRIRNSIQAFEWYHFQRPYVTSNPDFKVTVLFNSKMVLDRAILTMADMMSL